MANIACILGSFHKAEVSRMLDAAKAKAADLNLTIVQEIWVPGAYEKPLALKRVLQKPEIDAAVLLGIIEKGETKHGQVMGQSLSDAVIGLQLEFMKPVGMGILGPGIMPEQIEPRLEPYAIAAVEAVGKMLV